MCRNDAFFNLHPWGEMSRSDRGGLRTVKAENMPIRSLGGIHQCYENQQMRSHHFSLCEKMIAAFVGSKSCASLAKRSVNVRFLLFRENCCAIFCLCKPQDSFRLFPGHVYSPKLPCAKIFCFGRLFSTPSSPAFRYTPWELNPLGIPLRCSRQAKRRRRRQTLCPFFLGKCRERLPQIRRRYPRQAKRSRRAAIVYNVNDESQTRRLHENSDEIMGEKLWTGIRFFAVIVLFDWGRG